jgi:hypothetical protein
MSTWFQQLLPRDLLRRAGRGIAGAPVSASLALLTVGFSAASALPGSGRRLARTAAAYHGQDLMRAALWRLPLSALLAQSVLQLLWTLLLVSTLFTALEHVVGGVKLLLIAAAGHVLPTVAVDLFAMSQRWPRWLAPPHTEPDADGCPDAGLSDRRRAQLRYDRVGTSACPAGRCSHLPAAQRRRRQSDIEGNDASAALTGKL